MSQELLIVRDAYGEGVAAIAALGYTDDEGRAACGDHRDELDAATIEGVFYPAEYLTAGRHQTRCGLLCDTCGAAIVAPCDTCRAGSI
jgi:hypothetical protein